MSTNRKQPNYKPDGLKKPPPPPAPPPLRQLTQVERTMPGSFSRIINAMISRVLAGEDPDFVANDYGPWEWDAPPDLRPIALLMKKASKK